MDILCIKILRNEKTGKIEAKIDTAFGEIDIPLGSLLSWIKSIAG